MVRFAVLFLISLSLSNWAYNEMTLVYPPFERFFTELCDAIAIPTHDKWGEIRGSEAFGIAREELSDVASLLNEYLGGSYTRRYKRANLTAKKRDGVLYQMLSGEEAFHEI
ncbi:MAG: hypothetical protein D6808_05490 [Candidatus Dadabacteria bacterium]|nr:MAG: hypothetical protein D6808_05490 [Candidatus Dadabacteria bacterium]